MSEEKRQQGGVCRGCGARIIWRQTPAGKSIPCDPEPVRFWCGNPQAKGRVVNGDGQVLACDFSGEGRETGTGYIPHWSTCARAENFKAAGKPPKGASNMESTNRENLVERFEAELSKVQRPGMDKLLTYIRQSDFYTAPASTKYHLCTEGGLLQHSLNVLDALRSILTQNPDGAWEYRVAGKVLEIIPDDSVTMVALLHDICKTYFYSISYRNAKNDRTKRWEKVPYYTVRDRMPLGHGPKSAMIIKEYTTLTTPELYAIWWHMGSLDNPQERMAFNSAIEQHPFTLAVHTADMMASHFMEGSTGNKPGFTLADLEDETGEATMNERLEADAAEGLIYQDAPPVEQDAEETHQTPVVYRPRKERPERRRVATRTESAEGTESGQNAAVTDPEEQTEQNTTPDTESDCDARVDGEHGEQAESGDGGHG